MMMMLMILLFSLKEKIPGKNYPFHRSVRYFPAVAAAARAEKKGV